MSKSFASARAAALPAGISFSLSQLPARAFGEELWMQARSVQRRKAAAIAIFIVSIFALAVLDMLVIGLLGVDAAIDVPNNPCYGDLASGITSLIGYNVFIAQGIAFTTAKLIDIFAQLIVGQGGRALHAWLVYHVFSDAITRSIETTPASYAFILSAKFEPTALSSIAIYAKHIVRNSTARQRWLAVWFMMAAAYVLAFPTLVGASAGYFSPLVPYYQLPNGLLLSKEQVVWGDSPSEFTDYMDTEFHCYGVQHAQGSLPANASIVTQGDLGDFFRDSSGDYTPIIELEHCGWGSSPLVCAQANGYIWGMSTWMVVLATGLETIWICGMFGVWWDAQVHGEFNRKNLRRDGVYRSILDVAEALNEDLGRNHNLYGNKALNDAVTDSKVGYGMEVQSRGILHVALSARHRGAVEMHRGAVYG